MPRAGGRKPVANGPRSGLVRSGAAGAPGAAAAAGAALPVRALPVNSINGALMLLARHRWSIDVVTGRYRTSLPEGGRVGDFLMARAGRRGYRDGCGSRDP